MKIKIVAYKPKHTPAILEIINYNILHSTALYDYEPRSLKTQTAIFKEKLKKGFPIIVALENNTVVGFGYYSEFRFKQAYQFTVEHSVYVHNQHHAKGIGSTLLQQLIKLAQEQKLHTMVGVIDSKNKTSIDFHEKFGFKVVGTIKESGYKFNQWLDSVFMQKML